MGFSALGLSHAVLEGVKAMGYVQPTPIQLRAIPLIMNGQDVIGSAAGYSTLGFIPFATSFAVFMTNRAYDQIRLDICYNDMNVKIVCSHTGVTVGESDVGVIESLVGDGIAQAVAKVDVPGGDEVVRRNGSPQLAACASSVLRDAPSGRSSG